MSRSIEERLRAIEDRDEIARLQARYINYNDGGWRGPTHQHPEAVAALFTRDGVWDGPPAGRAEGQAAIADLFRTFQAMRFIVHYIANPLIEVSGDTAYGEWHAIIPATWPDGQGVWTLGKYINDYQRTADGWKYKKLRFEAAAVTPFEAGWHKTQFIGGQPPLLQD